MDGEREWGVTVLEANGEIDAGDVWASETFALREASKGSLYRHEVADAAAKALLAAVSRIARGERATPLRDVRQPSRGRARPLMRQTDRAIDWNARRHRDRAAQDPRGRRHARRARRRAGPRRAPVRRARRGRPALACAMPLPAACSRSAMAPSCARRATARSGSRISRTVAEEGVDLKLPAAHGAGRAARRRAGGAAAAVDGRGRGRPGAASNTRRRVRSASCTSRSTTAPWAPTSARRCAPR